ncbi:MAG TPA: class I SAM-dependent methyltransferase [Candidatus Saccharibacteria bacterium]|nr:class I SAM-dependent methyltransferase [Candidatus Saccharibacteria bacterium]HMT39728.1 class I SAM-dependent methyltransferase [Candidatus Saccharibacteria bacterium]
MNEPVPDNFPQSPKTRDDRMLLRALYTPEFDENLSEYLIQHDLDLSQLKGKVLDIGSGINETFSKEAAGHGVDVVSLNPNLIGEYNRILIKTQSEYGTEPSATEWLAQSVAGLAQELPFADNSFDTVISSAVFPVYIENENERLQILAEISRVLKPGGKAYLSPVPSFMLEEFESVLKKSGLQYQIERVTHPVNDERADDAKVIIENLKA